MSAEPLKFSDLLRKNRELGEDPGLKALPRFEIPTLSNSVTSQLNPLLEYRLRSRGINAHVVSGEYDNIVQDATRFSGSKAAVVLWELSGLVDGLQYKAASMNDSDLAALEDKTRQEISYVLKTMSTVPVLAFSRFSAMLFEHAALRPGALERLAGRLNLFLDSEAAKYPNVVLVDLEKSISRVSVAKSAELRFFYSSKALYSVDLLSDLSDALAPLFLSMLGKTKKVLVFDCDNTLWKGILGEDGLEGIRVSAAEPGGAPFEEVQHLAKALAKSGALLGICSKNNEADVRAALSGRAGMVLRAEDFASLKINWSDKTTNLRQMAKELNLGLDSFLFVDDSDFEIELIRKTLPEVATLKIPASTAEYPARFRESLRSFFQLQASSEDAKRGELYKEEALRSGEKEAYGNVEEYLASLHLKITVSVDEPAHAARIAQMTQKTNQFNLTTRRFGEAEIVAMQKSETFRVFAFSAADKFGDYGIVGVCIAEVKRGEAAIDSLLVSCRALGRNLEWAFFDHVLASLRKQGAARVRGTFLPTAKNSQVADFYERAGFSLHRGDPGAKEYVVELAAYKPKAPHYIGVQDGK